MPDIHLAAAQGYAAQADAYARGRPDYPAALLPWLVEQLAISPQSQLLDVGAGTGNFSQLLAQTGAHVSALEPVAEMRAKLAAVPGIVALEGTAQQLPLADGSIDLLFAAQAFHWFASTPVLDEFARVLKPGGKLVLLWNVRDESLDWVATLSDWMRPLEGDAPRFYKGDWRQPFPHPQFSPLTLTTFQHQHVGPPEQVIVERLASVSFIASLPDAERLAFLERLRELIATHPALAGKAEIRFPYRTEVYVTTRTAHNTQ